MELSIVCFDFMILAYPVKLETWKSSQISCASFTLAYLQFSILKRLKLNFAQINQIGLQKWRNKFSLSTIKSYTQCKLKY